MKSYNIQWRNHCIYSNRSNSRVQYNQLHEAESFLRS